MSRDILRKYIDILNENEAPVTQEELQSMFSKEQLKKYVKVPVAIVKYSELGNYFNDSDIEKINAELGKEDKVPYTDADKQNAYIGFQWSDKKGQPDIYLPSPAAVQNQYEVYTGKVDPDKVHYFKVKNFLKLQPKKDPPILLKKGQQEMILAPKDLAGKQIAVDWGQGPSSQTVQSGGYLTKNENGMIYTVGPAADGLPLGHQLA